MDTNELIYYNQFVEPVLNNVWISYFYNKNYIYSFEYLKQNSQFILNLLTENKNEDFIDYCNNIIITDIFNFLTCSISNFNFYKSKIINDYHYLYKKISIYNQSFLNTLYTIFYSIIYFVFNKINNNFNFYNKNNFIVVNNKYINDSDDDYINNSDDDYISNTDDEYISDSDKETDDNFYNYVF